MKISIKTRAVALLAMLAISSIALRTMAACNAPDGQPIVLTMNGPDYVGVSKVVEYSVSFSPNNDFIDEESNYAWGTAPLFPNRPFILLPPNPAHSDTASFRAPSTVSQSIGDTGVKVSFSDGEWHDVSDCNVTKTVTVMSLSMTGKENVTVGSTNEYTLTISGPSAVNTTGGTYKWSCPTGFSYSGETNAPTVKIVAPPDASQYEGDKNITCKYSNDSWSGTSDCSAGMNVTVIKIDIAKFDRVVPRLGHEKSVVITTTPSLLGVFFLLLKLGA